MYRGHIAQSLAPLYLGRMASMVFETRGAPAAVGDGAERFAQVFESRKTLPRGPLAMRYTATVKTDPDSSHLDRARRAGGRRRAVPCQARGRRSGSRSPPTSSRRAMISSPRVILYRRARTSRAGARTACAPSATTDGTGQVPASSEHALLLHRRGVDGYLRHLVAEIERRIAGGQSDSAASCWKAARSSPPSRGACRGGRGGGTRASRSSAARPPPASRPASTCSSTPGSVGRSQSGARSAGTRTRYDRELEVVVDRARGALRRLVRDVPALAGPRARPATARSRDCSSGLPEIQDMGFDVVYLPPIHPIGRTHRKGPNNALDGRARRSGQPVGDRRRRGRAQGGPPRARHARRTSTRFVAAARELGIEIALDFAIQCSPDHPCVREHPEWFYHRPDGTIKYAENPPKRYEDIYPSTSTATDLARRSGTSCKRVVLFWVEQGVRIFRVDNPHTKPLAFWEWLIARGPATATRTSIFLSEAFTRPKVMKALAKARLHASPTPTSPGATSSRS